MDSPSGKRQILQGLKGENRLEELKLFQKLFNQSKDNSPRKLPEISKSNTKQLNILDLEGMASPKSPYTILALPFLEKASTGINTNIDTKRMGTYGLGDRETAKYSRLHLALTEEPVIELSEQ